MDTLKLIKIKKFTKIIIDRDKNIKKIHYDDQQCWVFMPLNKFTCKNSLIIFNVKVERKIQVEHPDSDIDVNDNEESLTLHSTIKTYSEKFDEFENQSNHSFYKSFIVSFDDDDGENLIINSLWLSKDLKFENDNNLEECERPEYQSSQRETKNLAHDADIANTTNITTSMFNPVLDVPSSFTPPLSSLLATITMNCNATAVEDCTASKRTQVTIMNNAAKCACTEVDLSQKEASIIYYIPISTKCDKRINIVGDNGRLNQPLEFCRNSEQQQKKISVAFVVAAPSQTCPSPPLDHVVDNNAESIVSNKKEKHVLNKSEHSNDSLAHQRPQETETTEDRLLEQHLSIQPKSKVLTVSYKRSYENQDNGFPPKKRSRPNLHEYVFNISSKKMKPNHQYIVPEKYNKDNETLRRIVLKSLQLNIGYPDAKIHKFYGNKEMIDKTQQEEVVDDECSSSQSEYHPQPSIAIAILNNNNMCRSERSTNEPNIINNKNLINSSEKFAKIQSSSVNTNKSMNNNNRKLKQYSIQNSQTESSCRLPSSSSSSSCSSSSSIILNGSNKTKHGRKSKNIVVDEQQQLEGDDNDKEVSSAQILAHELDTELIDTITNNNDTNSASSGDDCNYSLRRSARINRNLISINLKIIQKEHDYTIESSDGNKKRQHQATVVSGEFSHSDLNHHDFELGNDIELSIVENPLYDVLMANHFVQNLFAYDDDDQHKSSSTSIEHYESQGNDHPKANNNDDHESAVIKDHENENETKSIISNNENANLIGRNSTVLEQKQIDLKKTHATDYCKSKLRTNVQQTTNAFDNDNIESSSNKVIVEENESFNIINDEIKTAKSSQSSLTVADMNDNNKINHTITGATNDNATLTCEISSSFVVRSSNDNQRRRQITMMVNNKHEVPFTRSSGKKKLLNDKRCNNKFSKLTLSTSTNNDKEHDHQQTIKLKEMFDDNENSSSSRTSSSSSSINNSDEDLNEYSLLPGTFANIKKKINRPRTQATNKRSSDISKSYNECNVIEENCTILEPLLLSRLVHKTPRCKKINKLNNKRNREKILNKNAHAHSNNKMTTLENEQLIFENHQSDNDGSVTEILIESDHESDHLSLSNDIFDLSRPLFDFKTQNAKELCELFQHFTEEMIKAAKEKRLKNRRRKRGLTILTRKKSLSRNLKQPKVITIGDSDTNVTSKKNSRKVNKRPTKMVPTTTITMVRDDEPDDVVLLDVLVPEKTKKSSGVPSYMAQRKSYEIDRTEEEFYRNLIEFNGFFNEDSSQQSGSVESKISNTTGGQNARPRSGKKIVKISAKSIKESSEDSISKIFSNYQRFIQLYKLCQYNHLDNPLFLTSSLSYMKHYQKEYDMAFGKFQQDELGDNVSTNQDEEESNVETSSMVNNDDQSFINNIVSAALVLDPLALDKIPGYEYAKIDFYVIRRQGPNTMLDSDVADDSKIYVGTSSILFGDKTSLIINNRIIIPIKLLFELDQINGDEFIYSSEDYKYFINAVVTYFEKNIHLESLFSSNNVNVLSTNKNKSSTKRSSTKTKSKHDNSCSSLLDTTVDSHKEGEKLEFFFGFELENIQDIHYTKQLPKVTSALQSNGRRKSGKLPLIKGEETHLLSKFDLLRPDFGDKAVESTVGHLKNIVTELNKWHRITKYDVFYRDNRNIQFDIIDFKRKLRSSPRKSGFNFGESYFITFRLVRTNMNKNKKNLSMSEILALCQQESSKQMINIFNNGQFLTWKKLREARNIHMNYRSDKLIVSEDGSNGKLLDQNANNNGNKRMLRANTRNNKISSLPIIIENTNENNNNDNQLKEPETIIPRLIHLNDSFKVIFNFAHIQSNLVSEDFTCPLCSRNFDLLAQLAIHLNINHERFKFKLVLDIKNRAIVIFVDLNDQFDPSFENDPLEKALNFRKRKGKKQRRPNPDHQPVTMMISHGCDPRTLSCMFLYNEEDQQFNVNVNRLISYEALSQRRVFYHSRTMLPILPAEMNEDSETDETGWRLKQKRHMMQDFIDVNSGEKAMMTLWNQFMMKNRTRYYADCHMADAVKNFMLQYTPTIIKLNLRYNCMLHLMNMFRFEVIEQDVVERAIQYLYKMIDCHTHCKELLQQKPYSQLPRQVQRLIKYFKVPRPPVEYLPELEDRDEEKIDDLFAKLNQDEIYKIFGPEGHLFGNNDDDDLMGAAMFALFSQYNIDDPCQSKNIDDGQQFEKHIESIRNLNQHEMMKLYVKQKLA